MKDFKKGVIRLVQIVCSVESKLEWSMIKGRTTTSCQVLNFYYPTSYSQLGIIISILLMREIRFREIKQVVHGHKAKMWMS